VEFRKQGSISSNFFPALTFSTINQLFYYLISHEEDIVPKETQRMTGGPTQGK
jgi:hypothetical protein